MDVSQFFSKTALLFKNKTMNYEKRLETLKYSKIFSYY